MFKVRLSLITVITLLSSACETDFDVLAPYQETMVVYGLLNASEKTQYIRVNKAFLGEGDALVMAKEPDSIYYGNVLRVKLERWENGVIQDSILLIRDSSIVKEPGIFASSPNILYKTSSSDTVLDLDSRYKVVVKNTKSGHTAVGETEVVGFVNSQNPNTNPLTRISWTDPDGFTLRYLTAPQGRVYNVIVRFKYKEVNLANPNDTLDKKVDWDLLNRVSNTTSGGENISQKLEGEDFYRVVASVIKNAADYNSNARRFIGPIDFIYTVGAEEFYTYYQVNQPSTGIVQSVPNYTNISNGFGIFSSRNITIIADKEMDMFSKTELRDGTIFNLTGDLNFQ